MKKHLITVSIAFALTTSVIIRQKAHAQNTSPRPTDKKGAMSANAVGARTNNQWYSIFVTNIQPGYHDWTLISVAREEGSLDDIRAPFWVTISR
jgi:hypothetical protein